MGSDRTIADPGSIRPLPDDVHRALPIVAVMGVISFVTTVLVFTRLSWLLFRWRRSGSTGVNQFIVLIFNLILADIQQATAFMLNAYWLTKNAIGNDKTVCWSQGWFVSTGDLSSGIFTFAIAAHAFADIVYGYKLKTRPFCMTIFALWVFVYFCSILGIAMHPTDYFARAGPWCFINGRYTVERLYIHYLWIIIAEFGTVAIYTYIFFILNRRTRTLYYSDAATASRAKAVAKMIVAYPIIYCVCTLPLVTARLTSMSGREVSYTYLCIGGAFVTSTGWLDVLLYTLTRSSFVLHGKSPDPDAPVIETFRMIGSNSDTISIKTTDSDRAIWSPHAGVHSNRSSHDHNLWANMDAKWENMRIQERASLSLRAMDMQTLQSNPYTQPAPEMPRFFQRIYHVDNISLTSAHSARSSIYNYGPSFNVAPVEKE